MELTKDIIDEVVLAARDVDYGEVTISISGSEKGKIVDIITKKRDRYRECFPTDTHPGKFQKDKF